MKLSLLTSVILAASLAPVLSAPTSSNKTIGAVYIASNTPTDEGNQILVSDIYPDGTVAFRNAIRAGGLGIRGYDSTLPVTPPLFSSGSVVVSQQANVALIVNAGANTMSIFTINPDDPGDVNLLAKPVGSGGEFPISAIFNKAGTKLCVLNGGEINGVACFKVDSVRGLIPISRSVRYMNLAQTTPGFGVPGSATQVKFSADEKRLIVVVKGSNTIEGFVAMWNINHDDSLSAEPTILNVGKNVYPFSLTAIPGSNAFISGDPAGGYDIINLDSVQKKSSKLFAPYKVAKQHGVCWSVQSPLTQHYYLTDTYGGNVVEVAISKDLKPTTVAEYHLDTYDVLLDIDVLHTPTQDFIYSLAANQTSINVLKVEEAGKAEWIQKYNITPGANSQGIPVDKLYVQGLAVYTKDYVSF
ncbi:hypothetical protein APHAL10511_007739 [Amanita phalloides]|nr:hypothetical protein APHAL10511_007739 [Amanita phalloides]